MLRYGPYAMFALLPAFGFLLKLLYLGRARRYPLRPKLYGEHMVFAAHNHAFRPADRGDIGGLRARKRPARLSRFRLPNS